MALYRTRGKKQEDVLRIIRLEMPSPASDVVSTSVASMRTGGYQAAGNERQTIRGRVEVTLLDF